MTPASNNLGEHYQILQIKLSAPADGRKHCPKHAELTRNNKLTCRVASCWLLSQLYHDARIHEHQEIEAFFLSFEEYFKLFWGTSEFQDSTVFILKFLAEPLTVLCRTPDGKHCSRYSSICEIISLCILISAFLLFPFQVNQECV